MRYWLTTLLGIALASAAVAVVAWCTRALVEHSLCTSDNQELACTTEPRTLAIAIGVCIVLVIPFASAIFMLRSNPRGTPLGALALGLALCAAGGAGLYAGIRAPTASNIETAGIIVGSVLLSIGPIILIFGMIGTGRRPDAPRGFAAGTPIPAGLSVDLTKQGFGQLAELLSQLPEAQRRAGGSPRGR
ncbi:hypothetical protein [Conexibacter sp. CPCC 205762]|uniref:hypothetical protein n=1 Tax=Conexibacter sp. CPCC 205762 TaxID=3064573 RepID=UPI00272AEBFE|nr:hypothetical protein [Conexibacter sp. CPCC 205762]